MSRENASFGKAVHQTARSNRHWRVLVVDLIADVWIVSRN